EAFGFRLRQGVVVRQPLSRPTQEILAAATQNDDVPVIRNGHRIAAGAPRRPLTLAAGRGTSPFLAVVGLGLENAAIRRSSQRYPGCARIPFGNDRGCRVISPADAEMGTTHAATAASRNLRIGKILQ